MSPTLSPARMRSRSRAPALRLLPDLSPIHPHTLSEPRDGHDVSPPALRVVDGPTRILLAGSDSGQRLALLDELTQTLSAGTVFAEADAICDVLEHASGSRMVIITGDLNDLSAEALLHMLAHRHPSLPVMTVDSPTRNGEHDVDARHDELRLQHA